MTCIIQNDRFYIMYVAQISNVEIIDLNSISVALAAMQLNSTTVLSPALTSLNQFFAQVVARYSQGYFSSNNSSHRLYYRQSCWLGNFENIDKDEF